MFGSHFSLLTKQQAKEGAKSARSVVDKVLSILSGTHPIELTHWFIRQILAYQNSDAPLALEQINHMSDIELRNWFAERIHMSHSHRQ